MILRERLPTILLRLLAELYLRTHRRRKGLPCGQPLLDCDGTAHTASTIEAGARVIAIRIVDRNVPHIDVVLHHARADMVYGLVVLEAVTVPVAAEVSDAHVAEAIVNATVEAYVRRPVAMMKAVPVAIVPPPAWSPKGALVRRRNPSSGNPVVPDRPIAPVTRRPEIIRPGSIRLLIDRKRRWGLRSLRNRVVNILRVGIYAILIGRVVAVLLLWVIARLQTLILGLPLRIVLAVLRRDLSITLPCHLRSLGCYSLHGRACSVRWDLKHIRRSGIGSIGGRPIFNRCRHQRSLLAASHQHHGEHQPC